jgi:hypothetical protein
MTDQELIRTIKELKQIKPRKDWVILTKNRIFNDFEAQSGFFSVIQLNLKPVLAGVVCFIALVGIFGLSRNTVPGDLLYSVKKAEEFTRVSFSSPEALPMIRLELANERLKDLGRIAEANRVKNLAPAIEEFQANVSEAAKVIQATGSDPIIIKGIAEQTEKLKENKEKVEALGVVIGDTEELENALASLVERELKYLETRTLSEEQQKIFEEAQKDYLAKDYSAALKKIIDLSYPQEEEK